LEQLWSNMNTLYPVSLVRSDYEERDDLDRQMLIDDFKADAQAAYDKREESLGEEVMRELERRVLLTVLDRKWREHLYEMDYLREGIGLRAMAQRDPLVEYQREGGDMFNAMMEAFMEEVVGYVFHLDVEVQQTPAVGVVSDADGQPIQIGAGRTDGGSPNGHDRAGRHLVESGPDPDGPGVAVHPVDDDDESEPAAELVDEPVAAAPKVKAKGLAGQSSSRTPLSYSAPAEDGSVRTTGQTGDKVDNPYANVGRNAPCPCGSGKKFKMCHGRPGAV
ncbi:MAG TPA: SEC-C metal-binding domain-containing protein, partial [Propionibacteriaceae bacterium]|nr:SEC-C metal-binding domain-containing protein [Propionibacteriaceae bacterium]